MNATAEAKKASGELIKFVTLGIGDERYGIEVGKSREIIARYEIVPLPKTPDFIEGIISLRGDIIPVVDLRKRFELEDKERGKDTRIIVVELADFAVGIQVDKVFEVLKLSSDDIEPPPPLVSGLKADYLEGVAEINEHLITILNLDKIFSTSERLLLTDMEDSEEEEDYEEEEEDEATAVSAPAPAEASATKATVSDDGMVELRGKSYFVGKRQKGASVELREAAGKLLVLKDGEEVKEFDI